VPLTDLSSADTITCMRRLTAIGALLVLGLVSGPGATTAAPAAEVAYVYDGDTIRLTDGRRVRLLQIDTPELGSGECYSRASRRALAAFLPAGSDVTLEADPRLDRTDRYGRLLRYVHRGPLNVNLILVRVGAAAPYFYGGDTGKYALRLLSDARSARAAKRGLWGACPHTALDPYRAIDTGVSGPPTSKPPADGKCDPNYTGACVPPYPPNLNCDYLRARGLAPVRSIGSDPHGLDGDRDGIGCE
jgi:micrococcal nuclease